MKVMRRVSMGLVAVAACASLALAAENGEPSLELNGGSLGLFVGGNEGTGTLTFEGDRYRFTFRGLTVGDVGVASLTGAGTVQGLKRIEDFSGNYTGLSAGLTVAGGGSAVAMRNQNGVTIDLVSTTRGLKVGLGLGGIRVEIPPASFAAVRAEKAAARAEEAAGRIDVEAARVEASAQRSEAVVAQLGQRFAARQKHVRRGATRKRGISTARAS